LGVFPRRIVATSLFLGIEHPWDRAYHLFKRNDPCLHGIHDFSAASLPVPTISFHFGLPLCDGLHRLTGHPHIDTERVHSTIQRGQRNVLLFKVINDNLQPIHLYFL
jgi:hypothetical protein